MRSIFSNPHRSSRKEDTENFYWISFSDVMAGLLAIFILALVAIMIQMMLQKNRFEQQNIEMMLQKNRFEQQNIEISKKVAEIEQDLVKIKEISKFRNALLEEIQRKLREQGILVKIEEESKVLRIPEKDIYFRKRKWQIPADVKGSLHTVGAVLLSALKKEERHKMVETIFIEGHTDSRPYLQNRGNWGLSADRAIEVWKFWREAFPEIGNLNQNKLFSVSGYGATRLVQADAVSEQDHKRNRRIDLRFVMINPDAAELKKIKGFYEELSDQN